MSTALSKYTIIALPFRIASCSLLEVGVFPTIVDSLAVEVMSAEVLLGVWGEKLPDIHQKSSRFPSTGQLHLVINHEGRGLCGFVHVKFN